MDVVGANLGGIKVYASKSREFKGNNQAPDWREEALLLWM
jgi:hypothetical protein